MARTSEKDRMIRLFSIEGCCPPPEDSFLQEAVLANIRSAERLPLVQDFPIYTELIKAVIAHWIIKLNINETHKHPEPKLAKRYQPLAEVYIAIYKACERIHASGGGSEYPHAGIWFALILQEFVVGIPKSSAGVGNEAAITDLRKKNQALKDFKNGEKPSMTLNQIFDENRFKNTHNLFQKLVTPLIQRDYDLLRLRLFHAITQALSKLASYLDSSKIYVLNIGEKQNFITTGRGRGRTNIPKFNFQS